MTFKDILKIFFKEKIEDSTRLQVKDVLPGQLIKIEFNRIVGKIGETRCINNDPQTKKILLEIRWGNFVEAKCQEYERFVFDYNSPVFANFHLLNSGKISLSKPNPEPDNYNLADLQKKLNEALEKEQYELASELQKKIDKLLTK